MAENFLALLEAEKPSLIARLPKLNEWLTPERWFAVVYDIARSPSLQKVAQQNPTSLINSLKKFAEWGLEPDGEEGFINVYNTKQPDGKTWLPEAVPQQMYKGIIRMAAEAGAIAHCVADVIKDGDTLEEVIDEKGRRLIHKRAFNAAPNRKLVGAYAMFWLPNGLTDYEIFEADDIERVKEASLRMAKRGNDNAKLSPAWQYSPGEMAKKSVLRRGLKRMRGRRNSDAADRFSKMLTDESTTFDAEIEGVQADPNIDHPVDTDGVGAPQPGQAVTPDVVLEGSAAFHMTADDVVDPDDRVVTPAEIRELMAYANEHGVPASLQRKLLKEKFEVGDLSQLRVGYVGMYKALIEGAGNG